MTSTTSAMTSSSAAGVSTMTSAAAGPSTSSITSSSSQYLHPEYIQLLPSSLDAKNSPLALLAQTCSSIGRDPTPPPAKSHSSASSSGSSSGCDNRKDSQYHHGKDTVDAGGKLRQKSESPHSSLLAKRSADVDDGHRSKRSRDVGASSTNSSSSSAASRGISSKGLSPSKSGRTPLKDDGRGGERSSPVDGLSGRGVGRDLIGCVKPTAAVSASSAVGSKGLSTHGALDLSSSDLSLQRFAALQQQLSLAAAAAAAAGVRSPLYPHAALFASLDHGMSSSGSVGGSAAAASSLAGLYASPLGLPPAGYIGHPGTLDPLSAYAASLQAASVGPSLYAEYAARLKAAAAATTCKDPYCIRCQLAATFQIPGLSGCGGTSAAGAAEKQSASSGLMPPPPMLPPYLPTASLHVLLQHLAAAGVEYPGAGGGSSVQSPAAPALYTCSWVDGASDFCGKRFVTSDELLQHLRTHASSNADSAAAQSLLPPSQGFHPAALAAAFSAAFQSSTPGQLSPTSDASRTCNPTSSCSSGSYSPTSLLASSRYNPYKPPSTSVFSPTAAGLAALPLPPLPAGSAGGASPGSAGAPPPLFPSLAAYYSPYAALYSQRLGAAAAVGP